MKTHPLFRPSFFPPALAVILVFCTLLPGRAARVPEARAEATHVMTGEVVAVFERKKGIYTSYVVRIRLESVEKGDGVAAGELFYVSCFKRGKVTHPAEPGAKGHDAVPKEGQRIVAFVNRKNGLWEGVYPDWFDVQKAP